MRFSFADTVVTPDATTKEVKRLSAYRATLDTISPKQPEYSLIYAGSATIEAAISEVRKNFSKVRHVVLIGIGGSSLGVEAVHFVLDTGAVRLSVLDTVSAYEIENLLNELQHIKKLQELAVCIVSKSGTTTETVVNAGIVLSELQKKWGTAIYGQTICIGDPDTKMMLFAKKQTIHRYPIPVSIGGRYSVATEVGLIPLALLGHDVEAFVEGCIDASGKNFESTAAESAARLALYIKKNFHHYNFFAFEKRLETLGRWYRQLFAESIGKAKTTTGEPFVKGFLPTISTPVELHSVGQLYLSGFSGVYTDFVTFDDEYHDFAIPKSGLAKDFSRYSAQEVTTALYGGVIGAYNERLLPYRTTIFDEESLAYSLGLFMMMRMRETMYVAKLLNLNAFDQPNVELYKTHTKEILGL